MSTKNQPLTRQRLTPERLQEIADLRKSHPGLTSVAFCKQFHIAQSTMAKVKTFMQEMTPHTAAASSSLNIVSKAEARDIAMEALTFASISVTMPVTLESAIKQRNFWQGIAVQLLNARAGG